MVRVPNIFTHWAWMLLVLLLTTMLIAHHLTTDVYWFDELANLRKMGIPPYPSVSLLEMITNVGVTKWPPAYNFVLLVWGQFVGWSEFATRTLSLFMGVLSVAMMYRLGQVIKDKQTAFISSILLSTSVFFIFYAHEVRGYIQYTLFSIIVIYLYWQQHTKAQLSRQDAFVFITASIILIYTHYVALFIVFAIGIYHLLFAPRQHQWGKRLRWLILIGVAYLPWSTIAVLNAIGETVKDHGLDPFTIIQTALFGFSNGLWFVLLSLILYAFTQLHQREIRFLLCMGTVFLVSALMTNQLTDFLFHIRHIIGLLPILVMLSAIGIRQLIASTKGGAWVFVIMWGIVGIWLNRDLSFMDSLPGALENRPLALLTEVQDITNTCIQADEFLITHLSKEQNIWNIYVEQYYLWQPPYKIAMIDSMIDFSNTRPDDFRSTETYAQRLQNYLVDSPRTWVIIADDAYTSSHLNDVSQILMENYPYCGHILDDRAVSTYVYQKTSAVTCPLSTVVNLTKCDINLAEHGN